MNKLIEKLSSRKLWVAVAGIATGVAMLFGVSESEITTVAGTILTLVSASTYIVAEGEIDFQRVKSEADIEKGGDCDVS